MLTRDGLNLGATDFLYVDDDITVPYPDTLDLMFKVLDDKPCSIVSGLYYEKREPSHPLVMACGIKDGKLRFGWPVTEDRLTKDSKEIVKVGAVPAGFLLVKAEVFEKVKYPPFVYDAPEVRALCEDPDDYPPGEDIYFSLKAREAGFDLYVDLRRPLLHYCPQFRGPKWLIEEYFHNSGHQSQRAVVADQLKQLTQ
jgi:GT2 family glycosyltransferase